MVIFRLFWRFVLLCTDLTNEFLDKNGPYLAAATTYYTLISLLPLTVLLVTVAGIIVGSPEGLEEPFVVGVTSLVPVSQQAVAETMHMLMRTRFVAGSLGLVGSVFASTTVFGVVRKGINIMWGVRKTRRFLHERLIDFSLAAGAGLGLLMPIFFVVGLGLFYSLIGETPPSFAALRRTLETLVTVVSPFVSVGIFMILYRFMPNTRVTFRDVWPGALLAGLAFEGSKWGFLWYNRTFPILYNAIYGPLSALLVLLTWVYVSAFILFYGALATARHSAFLSRKAEERAQKLMESIKKVAIALETRTNG